MNRLIAHKSGGKPIADEISRFKEIVDQPMGTVKASGLVLSDPSNVRKAAELLLDRNTRISTRAAWILGSAAAKNADISDACEELELALSDCERDMRLASGYALTMHHLNLRPGSPAPLAGHCDEAVRHGANIALGDRGRDY